MDAVGTQIKDYTEAYQEIDREIEAQPECQRLQKQLDFFQRQCVNLRRELASTQARRDQQRSHREYLLRRKRELEGQLQAEAHREHKYSSKARTVGSEQFKRSYSLASGSRRGERRRSYSLSRAASSRAEAAPPRNLTQTTSLFSTFRLA